MSEGSWGTCARKADNAPVLEEGAVLRTTREVSEGVLKNSRGLQTVLKDVFKTSLRSKWLLGRPLLEVSRLEAGINAVMRPSVVDDGELLFPRQRRGSNNPRQKGRAKTGAASYAGADFQDDSLRSQTLRLNYNIKI